MEFQEEGASRFQGHRHMKEIRLSALRTVHLYASEGLVRRQRHSASGRSISWKNTNDKIGYRTRNVSINCAIACPSS